MKKLLISLLLIIPFLGTAQDSWFNLEVQFDFYGPSESFVLLTQQGDTLVQHQPTVPYEILQTLVYADSGAVDVQIFDSFGDGWIDGQNTLSNITMTNDCQGTILDLDLNFAFTQYDTVVNLLACPPPITGCMDSNSVNYDPNATIDDGSCLYNVDFSLNMNQYNGSFTTPYVVGPFNNWTDSNPMVDIYGNGIWETTIALPAGFTVWKFMLDNFADQELPTNVQNDPMVSCFILDQYGFTNRILDVQNQPISLPTYCWESCYDCGDVLGCTDPTSNTYNPWATIDDGSCAVSGPTGCGTDQTYLKLVYTPDNWPNENEIVVGDPNGTIFYAPQGTYNQSNAPAGIPIEIFICVDTNVLVDITLADSYGDGYGGSTSGGSVDGNLELFDCDGVELFDLVDSLGSADFGYSFQSDVFNSGDICTDGGTTDILGCMNPFSTTYDSSATIDDGSCGPARVLGCTDSAAFNYDANANQSEIMQGDYTLTLNDGAANGWSGTWLGIKQGNWLSPQYKMGPNDGSSITFNNVQLNIFEPIELYLFTTQQSSNTINQVGYTLSGPTGDTIVDVPYFTAGPLQYPVIQNPTAQPFFGDVCIPVILGCMDSTSLNYIQPIGDPLVDVNTDDGSCIAIVEGCMNPLAFNYNPNANVDDGSCVPVVVGCMDSTQFNYDPNANTPGACIPFIYGCTDDTQYNYDPNANTDDNSCVPFIYGCTDPTSFNYDSTANTDDGSCIPIVYGCMDSTQFNYDPLANTDDGSCVPFIYGCMDVNSLNYDPLANTNQTSATDLSNPCIPIVYGCMDSTQFNYDPNANVDNGSCVPFIYGCMDPTSLNYNPLANTNQVSETDLTNPCIAIVYGCMDSTSFNYDPNANVDNGSCIPFVYGCMDPNSFNYDPNANVNQVSETDLTNPCIPFVYGCTDSTAVNYDPLANVDNGSCIESVVGCTDVAAYNYDPAANVSDSASCLYDAGCVGGPGEPYWLNNPCYAWVIDVDSYCCDTEWDSDCQDLYQYCYDGYPLDISELAGSKIAVYPNPTKDVLNVITSLNNVKFDLFDLAGKKLRSGENQKRAEVDMSNLPIGIYILQVNYDGNIYNKKIVKESN